MKFPKNNKGRLNWLALAIHKFWVRSIWVRWGLAPLITGVVPVLTVAYFSNRVFGEIVKHRYPDFSTWVDTNAWVILVSAFIYPTLLIALARFVMHRVNSNGINQDVLLSLIATLDRIVGCKAKRFGGYVTSLKQMKKDTPIEKPFEAITQPNIQIAEITRGVCELFNVIMKEEKPRTLIKVVLVEINNNKVVDLPVFFPEDEPPLASIKLLNQPESTIMTAVRIKKMVIISSTKKEMQKKQGRRYVASDEDSKESDCSLICFPIRHAPTNSVPFVLSIHSDEVGVFNKENSELYEHLLGRFERRISLEYSLMTIKEEVANREHN